MTAGRLICTRCGQEGHVAASCKQPIASKRGVSVIEDIRIRCYVEDDEPNGCWIWRGATSRGRPSLWIPAVAERVSLASALSLIVRGVPTTMGESFAPKCLNALCGNPAHRVGKSRSKWMTDSGIVKSQATCRRIAKGRRKKLFDEQIAVIRSSPKTGVELAAEFGVSVSMISKVRVGLSHRHSATAGYSVFALGATARNVLNHRSTKAAP